MVLPHFPDNPFQVKLSFHKIIEQLEQTAANDTGWKGENAKSLLQKVAAHPELKDGITDINQINDNEELIAGLLADLFPAGLSNNEIKAVCIPYQGLIFNYSERFKNVLAAAGTDFEINIRDFDDHQFYVLSCCIILNRIYGTNLDFAKPLFCDIPAAEGYMKHYRILYNADFMELIPTEKAVPLSQEDIVLLMNNYNDLALWKEKFPKNAWIVKGFTIMTLFDATVENAVSTLKSNLIGAAGDPDLQQHLAGIFRSIFRIADLEIGFTMFNAAEKKFSKAMLGKKFKSYLLPHVISEDGKGLLCDAYECITHDHRYFAVSDVAAFATSNPQNKLGLHFIEQDINSFILAPVVKNGALLGILELVSRSSKELNSVTALKLKNVMPFITDSIDRRISELQNMVRAVIQQNYTTLHPSVYWKFRNEAQNYILGLQSGLLYTPKEIVFPDVYPLYGQVDIKDSSITRNLSVKEDLLNQLNRLLDILEHLGEYPPIAAAAQNVADVKGFVDEIATDVKADTEQRIQHYLETHIYPLIIPRNVYNRYQQENIDDYFKNLDSLTGGFHANRRDYEKTLSLVNDKLVKVLDARQIEIQIHFPHYYERFKTDGVEHNLYIGSTIAQNRALTTADISRLRLWQLVVTAEMEIAHHELKPVLPYHLNVASLILVFGTPIAIRFRMDEKHFDIDGAYNIRYEVIKKRIDKAHIKNSHERITRKGKITIIYANDAEEQEYMQYIQILQNAGILAPGPELFSVEDLQGVSGLKAIRVGVLYDQKERIESLSYETLYEQLPVKI